MKYKMKLKVPIYFWDLIVYRMHPEGKTHKIPDDLKDELSVEMLEDLEGAINSGGLFGRCYWNDFHRMLRIIVCTENFEDGDYANKFSHEINHAIDKIIENASINDTEARSYLTGWMYHNFREKGFI